MLVWRREAGACIHSHHVSCVMATLLCEGQTELRITHQEMIKVRHGGRSMPTERAHTWARGCARRFDNSVLSFRLDDMVCSPSVRAPFCAQGIIGHGFLDELVVPIIENTPVESELTDSLRAAILK